MPWNLEVDAAVVLPLAGVHHVPVGTPGVLLDERRVPECRVPFLVVDEPAASQRYDRGRILRPDGDVVVRALPLARGLHLAGVHSVDVGPARVRPPGGGLRRGDEGRVDRLGHLPRIHGPGAGAALHVVLEEFVVRDVAVVVHGDADGLPVAALDHPCLHLDVSRP